MKPQELAQKSADDILRALGRDEKTLKEKRPGEGLTGTGLKTKTMKTNVIQTIIS